MKVDLIKMLKEFFEEQGYDVEEDKTYLTVSDFRYLWDDTSLEFAKDKIENLLTSIYSLGHDAGYSKGLKTMRHIQVKMQDAVRKEQKDEK